MKKYTSMLIVGCLFYSYSTAQIKILFDASKAETAGNADWVIDADQHNLNWNPGPYISGSNNQSNAQRIPTPAQSGISASTPETYWSGALSNWGIDCVKRGYIVESLPYNGQITYNNSSNAQDLKNYKVFIVDEPNIIFSAAEKIALMNFINNGGGLFMISDHDVSDRNGDGDDSPHIWNDFIQNNTVQNNVFGFSFDYANFSQTTSNVANLPGDSILHGPFGNVTQVKWSNGTTMTLNPVQNASVTGVIFKTGASTTGLVNAMCVYARVGSGKVAAIGDSSPPDDGTGDPNDGLYFSYTQEAGGNHQRLLMNATIWLAEDSASIASGINEAETENSIDVYPNPTSGIANIRIVNDAKAGSTLVLFNAKGSVVGSFSPAKRDFNSDYFIIDTSLLSKGIYYSRVVLQNKVLIKQIFVF